MLQAEQKGWNLQKKNEKMYLETQFVKASGKV